MAGALIELDLSGLAAAEAMLAEYQRLIASPRPLLKDIGEYLLESTDQRFDRREAPDGTPWAAVSPEYANYKSRGHDRQRSASTGRLLKQKPGSRATQRSGGNQNPEDILELTRDLRRLIRYQVNGSELLVGTDREYGATHQFGRGGIPARPFLGVSAEDEREIASIVRKYLQL
ncbi:phage virion morphogenesis protein [Nevskia sp.]|uniref:phage virion morphogenesis protein n=1 Tax=Nevskia sp. TaxID=1929292 RepID=UPI003F6FB0E5